MQKLRNISRNISSFRPSRFLKTKPENEKEKDIAGDSTSPRAEQNGVVGGVEGPRLNNSEERTLTSETPNEPSSPTTNASHRGVREGEGGVNIKRATRTRRIMIIISSLFHLLSVIFLILTLTGNTHIKPVLRSTFFFKINISNIIPTTAGTAVFTNSLARSLGLHDFYQVGLFNFCEGYDDTGLTACSSPTSAYWFNPIAIILNELLPGSTIAIPAKVVTILHLVKVASNVMSAFFITGCVINAVAALITPIVILSRWWSFAISIFTFMGALLTTAAAIIATVMWTIFRNTFTSQAGLNIEAFTGKQMFIFMWLGAGFSVLGWIINAGMCCCCASERDVKTGRKGGSKKAYPGGVYPEGVPKDTGRWRGVDPTRIPVTKKFPTVFRRRKAEEDV